MDKEKQQNGLRLELVEKMSSLASAGFGLVAALAWNEAIQALFKNIFGDASGLIAKFVYAGLITAVVVIVTMYISRVTSRVKNKTPF